MPLNFDAIIDITIKFTAKCLKIHYGWQGFEPASSPYLTLSPNLCVTVASWKLASDVRNLFRKVYFYIDIDVNIDSNIGLKQGLNEKKKKFKNIIMVDRDLNLHPFPHFSCTLILELQWLAGK